MRLARVLLLISSLLSGIEATILGSRTADLGLTEGAGVEAE